MTSDDETYLVTLKGWRRTLYRLTVPVMAACFVIIVLSIFGEHLGGWVRVAEPLGILSIALDLLFLKGPDWIAAPSRRIDENQQPSESKRQLS